MTGITGRTQPRPCRSSPPMLSGFVAQAHAAARKYGD